MKREFNINTEIYSTESIEQTITDFIEVTKIEFNNSVLVIEGKNKQEIEEIFNEFMNYLISNINENN